MVSDPCEYLWSSYRSNGLGNVSRLWTPHEVYLNLGKSEQERVLAYRALFNVHVEGDLLNNIRGAVNQGMALGSERFKEEIEQLTGRRVTPKKRGPEKRTEGDEVGQKAQQFLL